MATASWATLSNYAGVREDAKLDIAKYSELLDRVEKEIHGAQNRVKYVMNGFVIAVGSYIAELTKKAQGIGANIGKVLVEMNRTACKVLLAIAYIQKVIDKDRVGQKRKSARC
jgi:hypothetical protein